MTPSLFEGLAGVGINAVRIPLGHWIFGPPYPYHSKYGANPHPFVEGGIDVLDRAFNWAEGPFDHALRSMDKFQQDVAYRAYGAAQLLTFELYRGWFFWSYRTETTPEWCFRECVERDWLPPRF